MSASSSSSFYSGTVAAGRERSRRSKALSDAQPLQWAHVRTAAAVLNSALSMPMGRGKLSTLKRRRRRILLLLQLPHLGTFKKRVPSVPYLLWLN